METLDGVLSRVMFHKRSKWNPAGTPYLIGRLHNGKTVKGECRKPVEGSSYRFFGEWKPQKGYDEPAFEFHAFEAVVDRSASGAEQYLAQHVDGVGRAKAAALAEHFGADTLDVLRDTPERAVEVAGISEKIVEALREHFEEATTDPRAHARLIDLFNKNEHRISRKIVKQLLDDFGSEAPAMVLENPYRLLAYPGIAWKTADTFATATAAYDPAGIERHKAAILEAIEQVASNGHTYATRPEIVVGVHKLINQHPHEAAWDALLAEKKLACDAAREKFSTAALWDAEDEIARRLASLAAACKPLEFEIDPTGLQLDQLEALAVIRDHGVCLVTGPPGCGKSYTIARVIRSMIDNDLSSIRLVAPTGKAAKRAAELLAGVQIGPLQVPCTTIHRALAPSPSDEEEGVPGSSAKFGRGRDQFGFSRNESDPLEEDVVIVDESSMVDVKLGAALLRAIAPGTRLIFVGDQNQLPSVGPGSMLRDMIAAGIPRADLTKIKRSDGGGRVVRACHAIKDGHHPEPAGELQMPTENWIHIEESNPLEIARQIVELHEIAGEKYDPVWDFQVVSAQRKRALPFGCETLNGLLSNKLNPPDQSAFAGDNPADDSMPFRVRDKVIRLKNGQADQLKPFGKSPLERKSWDKPDWSWGDEDWRLVETTVVNGDLGSVEDIVIEERQTWVVVRFRDPERLCRIPFSEHHLDQAYAVTVHKSQGSGFPVVIVPVHPEFYFDPRSGQGLWCRELFYTAISRAEKLLITVGPWGSIPLAISRKTVDRRRTRLAGLISDMGGPAR